LTDTQILTLAISITFPVLGIVGAIVAVLYSNKRVDDLGKRMDDRFQDSEKRMNAFETRIIEKIDNGFEHMTMLLKLHEAEHHKH